MAEDQDTIQRCPHDAENPYAQISRSLIRDESISPECRWMLIYLLSMKDGWKLKIVQIYKHVKKFIGKNRVYELVQEAIEAGYIYREEKKVGNLKCGVTYFIAESPKFKKCFRRSDFREAESRDPENHEALSNNNSSITIEEKEKQGEQAPPTPPLSLPLFTLNQITMAQEDYDKLCEQFGADVVKTKLEELDDYSRNTPKKFKEYKCHATTIRQWIRRDQKTSSPKPAKPSDTNYSWLNKLKSKFSLRNDMHFSPEGLVIYAGMAAYTFKITENAFQERVISHLRKMQLPVDDL
jgi:hypothetical protein